MFVEAEILTGLAPDEVVAIGAARQASYLPATWNKDFEDLTISVQAASKGIFYKVFFPLPQNTLKSNSHFPPKVPDGKWQCVIPALSPIPFMKKMKLVVPEGSSEFVVEVAEDADEEGSFNNLGSVTLNEMKVGASVLMELKWTKYVDIY